MPLSPLPSFQSTLPRRERLLIANAIVSESKFQSTLPRRERLFRLAQFQDVQNFNPRSREGSDVVPFCPLNSPLRFQSTLPRRERLLCVSQEYLRCEISIHAPAKGATSMQLQLRTYKQISIHAPAKGATVPFFHRLVPDWDFNPRSREGSDPIPGRALRTSCISIHAPAKGATQNAHKSRRDLFISIHAPAKGATIPPDGLAPSLTISIHAPAKGATAILYNKFHFLCIILYILSAIT